MLIDDSSPSPASIDALLSRAEGILEQSGVPTPAIDASLLLAEQLGVGRGELEAAKYRGQMVDDVQQRRFWQSISRRADREPLQHILGVAAFRRLELAVGPGVFIPRPETELLVEHALEILARDRAKTGESPLVLDVGTGSGAIALSIATEMPEAQVFALEMSTDALPWTRKNFEAAGLSNATLIEGDITDTSDQSPLRKILGRHLGELDLLVSNPPYIPNEAKPRDLEVHLYDPPQALYGGEDGLDIIRVLSEQGQHLLRSGGHLLLEHGEAQADEIRLILEADGWSETRVLQDLTSRDRYTISTKLG